MKPVEKIKIGYVSPDFRFHPVAHFFTPLLTSHDRSRFEIYCYSNVFTPDNITSNIAKLSDHFISIVGMDDEDAADLIEKDGIDILIDLSGHTANNCLPVFNLKPAPVQITYLGYPSTTGLTTMDYRLTDNIADPPGSGQYYTEKLIRLDGGFLCYSGADHVKPQPRPCLKNQYITLGSFNNLPKINTNVIALWSRILHKLPNSRLILKCRQLKDKGVRSRIRNEFKRNDIPFRKVKLLPMIPDVQDHLKLYNKIDIALDTFPYNGTTTTFEALWMNVPVITLRGNTHAGRVGASILTHANLSGLIAENQDQYMQIVTNLAETLLNGYTFECRSLVKTACDPKVFTDKLEEIYEKLLRDG